MAKWRCGWVQIGSARKPACNCLVEQAMLEAGSSPAFVPGPH